MAECVECGGELIAYPRPDGYKRSKCKGCHNLNVTLRRYKLTREEYFDKRNLQDDRCAICREEKKLYVDHDHKCCPSTNTCGECVRGMLCHRCNLGIAFMESEFAEAAKEYLGLY